MPDGNFQYRLVLEGQAQRSREAFGPLRREIDRLDRQQRAAARSATAAARGQDRLAAAFRRSSAASRRATTQFRAFHAAILAGAIAQLGRSVVGAAASFEQLRLRLGVFEGSAAAAAARFDDPPCRTKSGANERLLYRPRTNPSSMVAIKNQQMTKNSCHMARSMKWGSAWRNPFCGCGAANFRPAGFGRRARRRPAARPNAGRMTPGAGSGRGSKRSCRSARKNQPMTVYQIKGMAHWITKTIARSRKTFAKNLSMARRLA